MNVLIGISLVEPEENVWTPLTSDIIATAQLAIRQILPLTPMFAKVGASKISILHKSQLKLEIYKAEIKPFYIYGIGQRYTFTELQGVSLTVYISAVM